MRAFGPQPLQPTEIDRHSGKSQNLLNSDKTKIIASKLKQKHWLIVIMGPTASGKTDAAVAIAQHFNTEIISADSRQFFREMNIGTAKPDAATLSKIIHHFIGHLSIEQTYTAGKYEADALAELDSLFKKHPIVVCAGGSTLYLKALLDGTDTFPAVDEKTKIDVADIYFTKGLEGLQKLLEKLDPEYYNIVDKYNHRRIIRALEVCLASGKPYSEFLTGQQHERDFEAIKIGLDLPREELYTRINHRCDEMLKAGLLDEVQALYPHRHLRALHTVGYTEFFDYLDGKYSYEEVVILFKQHTRNYAKRQLTWFRKDKDIKWFAPRDVEGIVRYIESRI